MNFGGLVIFVTNIPLRTYIVFRLLTLIGMGWMVWRQLRWSIHLITIHAISKQPTNSTNNFLARPYSRPSLLNKNYKTGCIY
uniref:ORF1 n=1 Tax=anatid alphaherpesvirus 1 TaxID=104388 RepID=C4PEF3_9ALPH|nr:ORF1 [Anatid alphaherpesvirus 1]ADU04064.1 ORF1 [Anatid alphaherpesvirus 1]